jgi:hypothetical protein
MGMRGMGWDGRGEERRGEEGGEEGSHRMRKGEGAADGPDGVLTGEGRGMLRCGHGGGSVRS